jgi:hypothetical protein
MRLKSCGFGGRHIFFRCISYEKLKVLSVKIRGGIDTVCPRNIRV